MKKNCTNLNNIKDKIAYAAFAILFTLMLPFLKYKSYKDKKYSCYRPNDISREFTEVDIYENDISYLKDKKYLELNKSIQNCYEKYLNPYLETCKEDNIKPTQIPLFKKETQVAMKYSIPHWYGDEIYTKERPYGYCIVIPKHFPSKYELIKEIEPLYLQLTKFISPYRFTYYTYKKDDFGTVVLGFWLLYDEKLLDRF